MGTASRFAPAHQQPNTADSGHDEQTRQAHQQIEPLQAEPLQAPLCESRAEHGEAAVQAFPELPGRRIRRRYGASRSGSRFDNHPTLPLVVCFGPCVGVLVAGDPIVAEPIPLGGDEPGHVPAGHIRQPQHRDRPGGEILAMSSRLLKQEPDQRFIDAVRDPDAQVILIVRPKVVFHGRDLLAGALTAGEDSFCQSTDARIAVRQVRCRLVADLCHDRPGRILLRLALRSVCRVRQAGKQFARLDDSVHVHLDLLHRCLKVRCRKRSED